VSRFACPRTPDANSVSGFIENIVSGGSGSTGGYPAEAVSAVRAHDLLLVDSGVASRGHRKMILNANAREIGLGYYQRRLPQNIGGINYLVTRDYYTQDVGLRSAWVVFHRHHVFRRQRQRHLRRGARARGVSRSACRSTAC
jgi:hypothetical protein